MTLCQSMIFSSKFMSRMLAVDPPVGPALGEGTLSPFTILLRDVVVPPSVSPFAVFSGLVSSILESMREKSPTFLLRPAKRFCKRAFSRKLSGKEWVQTLFAELDEDHFPIGEEVDGRARHVCPVHCPEQTFSYCINLAVYNVLIRLHCSDQTLLHINLVV